MSLKQQEFQKKGSRIFGLMVAVAMSVFAVSVIAPVGQAFAEPENSEGTTYGSKVKDVRGAGEVDCENGVKTSIIGGGGCYTDDGKGGGVYEILLIILNILTAGVGVLGVLGLVISGITYLTARDNEQQVAKAKSRILQIVIGLAIFAVLYVGLQWLIPGGIFGN